MLIKEQTSDFIQAKQKKIINIIKMIILNRRNMQVKPVSTGINITKRWLHFFFIAIMEFIATCRIFRKSALNSCVLLNSVSLLHAIIRYSFEFYCLAVLNLTGKAGSCSDYNVNGLLYSKDNTACVFFYSLFLFILLSLIHFYLH